MPRYLSGLALAFLVVGIVSAATMVPAAIIAGRRPSLHTIMDVWVFFGTFTVIALAVIVGPVILLLRRWLGSRFTVAKAMAVGAVAGPVVFMVTWVVTRECNETLGQLLSFWWRLPMELLLGLLPYVAAGTLFAGWLAADRAVHRRRML